MTGQNWNQGHQHPSWFPQRPLNFDPFYTQPNPIPSPHFHAAPRHAEFRWHHSTPQFYTALLQHPPITVPPQPPHRPHLPQPVPSQPSADLIVISSDEEDAVTQNPADQEPNATKSSVTSTFGMTLDNPIHIDDDSDPETTMTTAAAKQEHEVDTAVYPDQSLESVTADAPMTFGELKSETLDTTMKDMKAEINALEAVATENIQDLENLHLACDIMDAKKDTKEDAKEDDIDDLQLLDSDSESIDWSYVENMTMNDIKNSITSKDGYSPVVKTKMPKGVSLTELLECIEMYEESVRAPIERLDVSDEADRPVDDDGESGSVPRVTRGGIKRRQNDQEVQNTPSQTRPYVPYLVWKHSTWEDWAQLEQGDWLHWPFEPWEDTIIADVVERFQNRMKRRRSNSLVSADELWSTVASHLNTRRPIDCKRHWKDVEMGVRDPHPSPVIISKPSRPRRRPTMYELVSTVKISGDPRPLPIESSIWCNLERERTFGDGSADTFAVQVVKSKANPGFKVVAGAACNDQPEYNLPGNLRLWCSESDTLIQLNGHKTVTTLNDGSTQNIWHTITDVKASPDQRFLYSASHDKTAKVWCAETGRMLSTLIFHEKELHQIAVKTSTQEYILATGSKDGMAAIWRLKEEGKFGTGVSCVADIDDQESLSVETLHFGVGPSEHRLFAGVACPSLNTEGLIQSFDVATGQPDVRYQTMDGAISDVSVSYTGRYIVSGNYGLKRTAGDGFIHVNDFRNPMSVIKGYTGHADVNVVQMSPCETYVASGDTNNEVAIVDIRRPDRTLYRLRHLQQMSDHLIPLDSDMGISGIHWVSDSKTLITSGGDNSVKIWDIWASGELLRSYSTTSNISSLSVNEEAKVICAGTVGAQGIVHIWTPS